MYSYKTLTLLTLMSVAICGGKSLHPLSDDFINIINKEGKWKAGRNFPPDTPIEYIKRLGGAQLNLSEFKKLPVVKHDQVLIDELPESFDPREKWPNCQTLNEIRDQGKCGACWAFGAVEAMTDRVCIYFNGTKNFHFSAKDLVTCNSFDSGCDGGSPIVAWNEWVSKGLVSGGNYNSHEGCKPYSFPPCANHLKNCTDFKPTPACTKSCEKGYKQSYKKDKKRGSSYYYIETEKTIMAELYTNGPVEASFNVYEDFADYKGGVYQHIKGKLVFGHAVKLMGWGVENGTKYWLAANSWGTGFGEEGFFKILRGVNECNIEDFMIAGEPLVKDYY